MEKLIYDDSFHTLYSSPNIIRMIESRRMKWMEHVTQMKQMRNAYKIVVGKPEEKGPPGRSRLYKEIS
jgi:hypothetical protein